MENIPKLTEIKKHLSKLMEQVHEINSLILLIISINDNMEDYEKISKQAPFFFGYALNSFYRSLIIENHNLFDYKAKDSQLSICKLLNEIELNLESIESDKTKRSSLIDSIKIHRNQIEENEGIIKKNIQLRHNFFAHLGKTSLDNPDEIENKYSVLVSDEQKLVQTGKEILTFWCKQLSCNNCEIGTYEAGDFIRLIKKINTDKNLQ